MGTLLASGKPGQELSVGPTDPVWSGGFLTLGGGKEGEAGEGRKPAPRADRIGGDKAIRLRRWEHGRLVYLLARGSSRDLGSAA